MLALKPFTFCLWNSLWQINIEYFNKYRILHGRCIINYVLVVFVSANDLVQWTSKITNTKTSEYIHIETFIILSAFYFKYFQSAKMMKICCYTSWNDSWKPPTSSNINNGFQSFKFSIFFIITHKLLPSITGRSVRFGKSKNYTQQRIFGCIRAEYFSILHLRFAPWIPQDSRELWSRILGSNMSE